MGKAKFYVAWRRQQVKIFDHWESCNQQVRGVAGAVHKLLLKREEAEAVFRGPSEHVIGNEVIKGAAYTRPGEDPERNFATATVAKSAKPIRQLHKHCIIL